MTAPVRTAMHSTRRGWHRAVIRLVVTLVAASTVGGTAQAASSGAAEGVPLIARANLYAEVQGGAEVYVLTYRAAAPGTTYEFVWSDERGERARTTTTDRWASTPVLLADYGRTFTVTVTASEPGVARQTVGATSTATRWVNDGSIFYDGSVRAFSVTPRLPDVFTADLGQVTVHYRWTRSGAEIPSDPARPWTHVRVDADQGKSLAVEMSVVQESTGAGSLQQYGPTPTIGSLEVTPLVSGTAAAGSSLSVSTWASASYPPLADPGNELACTYQWYRDGAPVYGGTSSSHAVHTMERGRTLRARVTCAPPGYTPVTRWTEALPVPGSPELTSRVGGDTWRDLVYFANWAYQVAYAPGRPGHFDFVNSFSYGNGPNKAMTALATAGDLDDDGTEDLLARDAGGALWLFGGGPRVRLGYGWNAMNLFVAGGDADGDGTADLWARRSSGELVFYPGRARRNFAAGAVVSASGFRAARQIVTTGDANGDGRADVYATWADGTMTLHAGLGNGRLAAGVRVGGGWQPMSRLLPARDLARDGRPDLLALDGQGRLWLYPGNGRGGFLSRTLTNPGTSLTTRIF